MTFFKVKISKFSQLIVFAKLWSIFFSLSKFCSKISRSRLKNSMTDSKLYGFPVPSKMIYVDDGVAAVGYKSSSTPPLLILNGRRPLVLKYRCIGK